MKTIILLLLLISSLGIFAQEISKSDFKNSEWFTNTSGENLFKTDTLLLSKTINIEPKKYSDMCAFLQMDYLKTNQFITLDFRKKDIFIGDVKKDFCGFSFFDQFKWQFDNKTQHLKIYKNDVVIAEYEINSQTTDFAEWSNNSEEKLIELSADVLTLELNKLQK